jgi:transcription initiation factor TFIIIB Brf1 subunit/transcription initiation factor TFIIB
MSANTPVLQVSKVLCPNCDGNFERLVKDGEMGFWMCADCGCELRPLETEEEPWATEAGHPSLFL